MIKMFKETKNQAIIHYSKGRKLYKKRNVIRVTNQFSSEQYLYSHNNKNPESEFRKKKLGQLHWEAKGWELAISTAWALNGQMDIGQSTKMGCGDPYSCWVLGQCSVSEDMELEQPEWQGY